MTNNKFLALAAVLLIAAAAVLYFTVFNKSTNSTSQTSEFVDETIPTIAPADLGLVISVRSDKRAVKFELTKAEGVTSVEYQIAYTKEVDGEEVPEALIGESSPKNGKVSIDYRELGTCSANVCRYDKVVSDIKVILKVVKDGKTYSSEDSASL